MDPVSTAAVGWAISTAGWIISPIIAKLMNRVSSLVSFDVSNKIRDLETCHLPRLVLAMAALERSRRPKLEKLVRELKSALYQVEDILDDVEYCRLERKIANSKKERKRKSASLFTPTSMSSITGVRIESSGTAIPGPSRSRLKDLLKMIEKLIDEVGKIVGFANHIPNATDHKPNATANYSQNTTTADPPPEVKGRDENRDHLRDMLRAPEYDDDRRCYSVIGIHGIPGSGKTTLAQYVCESEKNDDYFDIVMWIHVTQNFSVDTIYREMFEAASDSSQPCPAYNSLDVLQRKLKGVLQEKRFLLVLDDIWCNRYNHGQKLEELLRPLNVAKKGSKILVTSRTSEVLSELGPVRCTPFPIPELKSDDFLQLFMHHALGDSNDRDKMMYKVIGAEIARKLKGSPLAATVVGAQLRNKAIDDWEKFNAQEHLGDVMDFLRWSYQHLDENVRRCFAYCSIFPRRHWLQRDELIKLWVAQGFMTTADGEDKEVVAERHFNKLVSSLFLQPIRDRFHQQHFNLFIIHDLLHDLAEEAAGSECFTIQKGWTGVLPQDVRHLFIDIDGEELSKKVLELEKLRTLIIIHTQDMESLVVEQVLESVFSNLPMLRALIVKVNFRGNSPKFSIPESIGKLIHLRYLGFSRPSHFSLNEGHFTYLSARFCDTMTFPCSFARLYHMEVIDVECRELMKFAFSLGKDTSNLVNLQEVPCTDLPYIGMMESLRELKKFTVKKEEGYELYQLKQLNKIRGSLYIDGLENVPSREDALEAELHKKKQLTELKLKWSHHIGTNTQEQHLQSEVLEALRPPVRLQALQISGYKGSRYPGWMMSSDPAYEILLYLTLFDCSKLEHIPNFGKLHTLRVTSCDWDYFPENMEQLQSLKELEIDDCPNLQSVPTILPQSLKTLTVSAGCEKIISLPILPQSLVYFELTSYHREFIISCETPGDQNCENIRHIPQKTIEYIPSEDYYEDDQEDNEELEASEEDEDHDEWEDNEDLQASEDDGRDV